MKKAFSYMFCDEKFLRKSAEFFIYAVLVAYCSLFTSTNVQMRVPLLWSKTLIIFAIYLLVYFVVDGYRINIIKNLKNDDTEEEILSLSLKRDVVTGFKYGVAKLLFAIPWFCLIIGFAFSAGVSMAIQGVNVSLPTILMILMLVVLFLYVFYINFFAPANILNYAETGMFTSFYMFDKVFGYLKQNWKRYIVVSLLYFLCTIIVLAGYKFVWMFCRNIPILYVIMVLLPTLLMVYFFYMTSYMVAKISKND